MKRSLWTGLTLLTLGTLLLGTLLAQGAKSTLPKSNLEGLTLSPGFVPLLQHQGEAFDFALRVKNSSTEPREFILEATLYDSKGETLSVPEGRGEQNRLNKNTAPEEQALPPEFTWSSNWTFPTQIQGRPVARVVVQLLDTQHRLVDAITFRLLPESEPLFTPKTWILQEGTLLRDATHGDILVFQPIRHLEEENRSWVWARWLDEAMIDHKLSIQRITFFGDNLPCQEAAEAAFGAHLELPDASGTHRTFEKFFLPSGETTPPILSAMRLFEMETLPSKPELLLVFLGSTEQKPHASKPYEYGLLLEWMAHRLEATCGGRMILIAPVAAPRADLYTRLAALQEALIGEKGLSKKWPQEKSGLTEVANLLQQGLDHPENLFARTTTALETLTILKNAATDPGLRESLQGAINELRDPGVPFAGTVRLFASAEFSARHPALAAATRPAVKTLLRALIKPETDLPEGIAKARSQLRQAMTKTHNEDEIYLVEQFLLDLNKEEEPGILSLVAAEVPNNLHPYLNTLVALSGREKIPLWRLDQFLLEEDRKEAPFPLAGSASPITIPNSSWRLAQDNPLVTWRFPNTRGHRLITAYLKESLNRLLYSGPDPE